MSIMDFCLWVAILTLPGILLAKLFFFVSAGWTDLLTRLIVSHFAALICISNLCIMVSEGNLAYRTIVLVWTYALVQFALLAMEVFRFRLGNVLKTRLTAFRMMVWPRRSDQVGMEPAE